MSYHGGPPTGNGYWPGQDPPNDAYGVPQSRPPFQNDPPLQYRPPANEGQYWNQHSQTQYGMNTGYVDNGSYAPAPPQPQIEQPQFISPAQLFQQAPAPSLLSNQSPHVFNLKTPSNPTSFSSSRMAPEKTEDTQPDMAKLLTSLAEEYFEAAHELAPAAAFSMTVTDIDAYESLIATGLGCLDTALKRVRLQPRDEAIMRLRYAGVLFEETENSMEAETALGKGIALCERVCTSTCKARRMLICFQNHYYDLKYAMQFLLAQFMAKKNPKASMKALDGHISDAHALVAAQ
jgi:Cohesin loading factor